MHGEMEMRTSRLLLLPSSDNRDLADYKKHLTDADEFFMQFGLRMTDEILDAVDFHSSGVIYYTVFSKKTREMVGYVGILPYGMSDGIGELEFHIFREHRNKGYCAEASRALLEAFFDGSLMGKPGKSVVAETMPENIPTCRVLEKLGFEKAESGIVIALDEAGELDQASSYSVISYELQAERLANLDMWRHVAERTLLPMAS